MLRDPPTFCGVENCDLCFEWVADGTVKDQLPVVVVEAAPKKRKSRAKVKKKVEEKVPEYV